MFDFTRNVKLEPKSLSIYGKLQATLYLAFFVLAVYLGYLISFPSRHFSFLLSNPNQSKNNITLVKLSNGTYPENGIVPAKDSLTYHTDITNDYSSAEVKIMLHNDSPDPVSPSISVRKSYQAFMYPEGEPIGFKDGSLLTEGEKFYIVSDGLLRKFSETGIMSSLGYTPSNFKTVSKEELRYNPKGDPISEPGNFPNGALFKIEDAHYILSEQKLKKFAGENPFLSQYDSSQALKKNPDFLQKFPMSDELVGFSDGTLVSNADSVFIISEGKIFPIDSVETFEAKGFNWEDILPAGTDELALYERAKLFNLRGVHPSGTIYKSIEDADYYLVRGEQKHSLPSEKIASSWNKMTPVLVSEKALDAVSTCAIKKTFFDLDVFNCEIPLENFAGLPGGNYEFAFQAENEIRLQSLGVKFEKKITKANFKFFLLGLKSSIITNYEKTAF
jgi:hypothetical protein